MSLYILLISKEVSSSPAILSPVVTNGSCPSNLRAQREALASSIEELLKSSSIADHCPCGEQGKPWSKVAHLNMSDPEEQCPANWTAVTRRGFRWCDTSRTDAHSCDSAFFQLPRRQDYSHVCGRVIGYQRGSTDAFSTSIVYDSSLNDAYIDGVSLTHGVAGSRQHIWSFVAAQSEDDHSGSRYICHCIDIENDWPYHDQIPSFIGNNYYCDTGGSYCTPSHPTVVTEDPLWDGQGCGPSNTCCTFNNPPWFCATLPHTTMDDIEMRLCASKPKREASVINLVEIYVS